MRRLSIIGSMLLACSVVLLAAPKQPKIVVHGPTIIAFFSPVTQAELDHNTGGANEALSDFQFYAAQVREPFSKSAIAFHEIYARSFRVTLGSHTIIFRPEKVEVGYYLVAPGKEPRVEYGVMTDTDLLGVAREYFGSK